MKLENNTIEIKGKKYLKIEIPDETLGLSDLSALKNRIDKSIKKGKKLIVLDLKNVLTINSAGLGIIIGILKRTQEAGGDLKVINVNEKILNIIKITKLNLIIDII
ncbi:MAG: STAS domain-containing protein [Ignavibacteria bacterium]|nr:STAS domain-containing protein [Ignavibacteria bacterium]